MIKHGEQQLYQRTKLQLIRLDSVEDEIASCRELIKVLVRHVHALEKKAAPQPDQIKALVSDAVNTALGGEVENMEYEQEVLKERVNRMERRLKDLACKLAEGESILFASCRSDADKLAIKPTHIR